MYIIEYHTAVRLKEELLEENLSITMNGKIHKYGTIRTKF
jgi:hypothetical protein